MLLEIRRAIADSITTQVGDIQVSPYMLSNPSPPAAHVYPDEITYDLAMQRGLDEWQFILEVFVGLISDKGAQIKLDEYLEPFGGRSIKQAVETDRTLGALVADASVTSASGYRQYLTEGRGPVLGCAWTITVRAGGA